MYIGLYLTEQTMTFHHIYIFFRLRPNDIVSTTSSTGLLWDTRIIYITQGHLSTSWQNVFRYTERVDVQTYAVCVCARARVRVEESLNINSEPSNPV
jgi:16S rRNA U1498 N3-methylase RsmE